MGQQLKMKGTEDPNYPDVEAAAEEYRDVRDRRMALTDEEVDKKEELHRLMKKHKLKTYRLPNSEHVAELVAGEETVKVRKVKDGEGSPARTRFEDDDKAAESKTEKTAAPEPPKSEPRKRSKPKGDGTRAHADGKTTEITDPKGLIDLADEGAPKPRKKAGKGKRGKRG